MKPLPTSDPHGKSGESRYSSLLPAPNFGGEISSSNHRRSSDNPIHRAYPWLLCASTAIATIFCFMYITKPVIQISSSPPVNPAPKELPAQQPVPAAEQPLANSPAKKSPGMLPGTDRLPGEPAPLRPSPAPSNTPGFEETNLSVQHVLNAETPSGLISKITLDVPVLYQSRQLRWTQNDLVQARDLLTRLTDYQEKCVALRSEGTALLADWNRLLNHSIPGGELRADSPTLPVNQRDAAPANVPAGFSTGESIQVKPSGK